jgi:hypothetical protein
MTTGNRMKFTRYMGVREKRGYFGQRGQNFHYNMSIKELIHSIATIVGSIIYWKFVERS